MNSKVWLGISLISILMLLSCGSGDQKQAVTYNDIKETLVEENKNAAQIESDQIDQYIKRHQLNAVSSGTGLRYQIYQKGTGVQAEDGQVALVHYTISLLNGKKCYSTIGGDPESFVIGHDNVESGLHEGIKYLHVGDKATLIIPSHLAHGLIGDQNKIPPRSTIIYDIELLGLK